MTRLAGGITVGGGTARPPRTPPPPELSEAARALAGLRSDALARAADAALADPGPATAAALARAAAAVAAALDLLAPALAPRDRRPLAAAAQMLGPAATGCRELDLAAEELARIRAGLLPEDHGGLDSLAAELHARRARRAGRLRAALRTAQHLADEAPPAAAAGAHERRVLAAPAAALAHRRLDELLVLADPLERPAATTTRRASAVELAARRLAAALSEAAAWHAPAARGPRAEADRLAQRLGELRRCDELRALAVRHRERLREDDAALVRASLPPEARDVLPGSVVGAPQRRLHRGLEALDTYLRVRRRTLTRSLARDWGPPQRAAFAAAVRRSLGP